MNNDLNFEDYLESIKLQLKELENIDATKVITDVLYDNYPLMSDIIKDLVETNCISVDESVYIAKNHIDNFPHQYLDEIATDDVIDNIINRDKPELLAHYLVYTDAKYSQELFDELLYYSSIGRLEFDVNKYNN